VCGTRRHTGTQRVRVLNVHGGEDPVGTKYSGHDVLQARGRSVFMPGDTPSGPSPSPRAGHTRGDSSAQTGVRPARGFRGWTSRSGLRAGRGSCWGQRRRGTQCDTHSSPAPAAHARSAPTHWTRTGSFLSQDLRLAVNTEAGRLPHDTPLCRSCRPTGLIIIPNAHALSCLCTFVHAVPSSQSALPLHHLHGRLWCPLWGASSPACQGPPPHGSHRPRTPHMATPARAGGRASSARSLWLGRSLLSVTVIA